MSLPVLRRMAFTKAPSLSCPGHIRTASTTASSSATSTSATTPPPVPVKTAPASPQYFKVQLIRSAIGLTPLVRNTVKSMRFKHRMHTVYTIASESTMGRILKIKELVKVEVVSKEQMLEETAPKDRRANKGYTVVGSALR